MVIYRKPVVPRRATRADAKARRRDDILAAATEAFDRFGYAHVNMSWLAERTALAKGTLYLYYPSKEAVFVAVYQREFEGWLARVDAAPGESAAEAGASRLAGIIADATDAQPRLAPLAAILHTTLERNLDETALLAFRRRWLERLASSGTRLEEQHAFLQAGDGLRLLLRVHAVLIGCWHLAAGTPVLRRARQFDDLAGLPHDFSEEFENTLLLLFEGWRHAGGGF